MNTMISRQRGDVLPLSTKHHLFLKLKFACLLTKNNECAHAGAVYFGLYRWLPVAVFSDRLMILDANAYRSDSRATERAIEELASMSDLVA